MMMKRWSVEIPAEAVHNEPDCVTAALEGYVGKLCAPGGRLIWCAPGDTTVFQLDFMPNTILLAGEHDPACAESQVAVARLAALVRR
jgi:hypothetical protein